MADMLQETAESRFQVAVPNYNGPLDLLLYLVRRDEIDILNLPIARITGQFLEYLAVLELTDLEEIGEFVVMASTLMEIKSRMVLPRSEEPSEETVIETVEDPRSGLVQRLMEYKRIRDAATVLEQRAMEWHERYPRLTDERPVIGKNPATDRLKDVELWDLVSALVRLLKRTEIEQHSSIRYDDTPIQVHADRIAARVRQQGSVRFSELYENERERSRIVGMFLALLELIRHHGFRAVQEADFGEIIILAPVSEGS